MKCLVIDDSVSITMVISEFLKSLGIDCITANSSKSGKFDLVFLDLAMPELTGMDILEKLEMEVKIKGKKIIVFSCQS